VAIVGGEVGYRVLRAISPGEPKGMGGSAYAGGSKLEKLLGTSVWEEVRNKIVIDFGCGSGSECIELAQRGSRHVYGIDISERLLAAARRRAEQRDCRNVTFSLVPPEPADIIISVDAFEHFADPGAILNKMATILRPEGRVLACFGPTWYHPRGGHLFSVFPWAHLIFSEESLCRWRSHIRNDGARRFVEVEGGLNQMTIARFEQLVNASSFQIETLEAIPIRPARRLHNRITREFLTSVVRCRLRLRDYR
jgi:SAM-dependent methyltransferase